jgi:hypothetical protein
MLAKLASIRKAIATAIGVVLTVLTFVTHNFGGIIPAHYMALVGSVFAILTTVATFLVPNKTPAPTA